jgi:hypothetical protein
VKCAVEIVEVKVSLGRRTQERNNNDVSDLQMKRSSNKGARDRI